ncbi:GNAT family N-acetyltransferase [Mycolicibacterium tusciae]|uniref:GNAT family N-acetyltransferase n=1 Tax=Mycolicibacterium tusciae TaxID=75922 RepID=UPI00024A316A|nr:GNAT family N-acetyltransferase [Mycolicibacterium tusciae]
MRLTIEPVTASDLPELMPMMRSYCDFYRVDPPDDRLLALANALIENPDEGLQLIARGDRTPLGFATIYWSWQTLYAARVGVLNDLYVESAARGTGTGRALIDRGLALCRDRGAEKLVWETAPDNATAQRLYDGIGAAKSTWLSYELDA